MARGRQLQALTLTVQENNQLVEWTRRHKTSQALALRARIILACAQDTNNSEVAERCRVTRQIAERSVLLTLIVLCDAPAYSRMRRCTRQKGLHGNCMSSIISVG